MIYKVLTDPWLHIAALLWVITAMLSTVDEKNIQAIRRATVAACDFLPTVETAVQAMRPGRSTASEVAAAICARVSEVQK